MEKEFIPYEEALALKELGFDEPCLCVYIDCGVGAECFIKSIYDNRCKEHQLLAPLYQQAFRWFREKYNVSPIITCYSELGNAWKYHIPNEGGEQGFNTYEEAEFACLKKLIEIVKNK
jgi:hypothetical protein